MSGDLSGFSLIDLFRMEAEVQTEVLSSGLLALEKNAADPVVLESLMRAAHSLKGAARIVDLDAAVSVAHKLEDCFVAAQRGKVVITKENVDALLAGVDLLSRISKDPEAASPEWPEAHQDELLAFDGGIERILKNAPAAQPPAAPLAQPAAPARLVVSEAVVDPSVPDDLIPAAAPNAPEEAAPADAEETRVVRVTAASMTRLTALAGESLVQSRGLAPFLKVLDRLRQKQTRVLDLAGTLDRGVGGSALPALARDLFDQFKEEASEMLVQINDCRERFEDLARKSEDLSTRLEHEVLANRMRPISDALKGLPRLARDLSRRLGKSVELVIVGESTGVDRDILDRLEAPLSHLLRNAIDHAVEAPDERRKAGKAETSRIRIEAGHRGGMLHVAVQDDGKGIDVAGLRRKVVEKGLLAFTAAQRLSEQELLDFLFLPGFSTKEEVTEISGRGVGLDVAAATAREVGGSIGVSTKLGKGTRFVLQLPITTSIVRALLVEIAGEPYAFPLNRIDRILLVNQADLQDLQGRQHCLIDGQPVGLVSASQVLAAAAGNEASDPLPCVVVSDRAHRFALAVDRFLGERDLDVRPIDPRLGRVANFNSASLLDDGWPVLIFDVDDLVRSIVNLSGDRRLERIEKSIEGRRTKERGEQRVLVVEDSITVRELERQILEARGYTVDTAVDGADGWNLVRTRDYRLVITDVDMPRMDGFELVRLIRSDPRISSIPVVIVSYKEGDEHKMRGLDVGASAYLTKSSFRDQTFMETVVDLIGEAQA